MWIQQLFVKTHGRVRAQISRLLGSGETRERRDSDLGVKSRYKIQSECSNLNVLTEKGGRQWEHLRRSFATWPGQFSNLTKLLIYS